MIGPTNVVINAGGSFGLPEATRQFAERGWTGMVRVTRLVTGAGFSAASACAIAVLLAAPTLMRVLYGRISWRTLRAPGSSQSRSSSCPAASGQSCR